MLNWLKRRRSREFPRSDARPASPVTSVSSDAAKPKRRVMTGTYVLLYKYLENRYADTVVLTFAEIEDLLGFALPEQARLHREWWTSAETDAGSHYSDSWVLASRTAVPNLVAGTVVFERAS